MACNCGKNKDESIYLVTLRNGKTVEVKGERAARIEVTKAGGGTYRLK